MSRHPGKCEAFIREPSSMGTAVKQVHEIAFSLSIPDIFSLVVILFLQVFFTQLVDETSQRAQTLTTYDAAYLELAVRRQRPSQRPTNH